MGFKKNIYLYCLSKSIWIDSIGRLQSKNTPKPWILVIFGLVYGMCMPKYEKILKHAELLDYTDMGTWAFWLFIAYLEGSIEFRQADRHSDSMADQISNFWIEEAPKLPGGS